uniref:Uncharacterized protein n=1 Tax=Anguilla anguilla TaxID=7936 RepID=A0A0E9TD83_ANGAN
MNCLVWLSKNLPYRTEYYLE